MPSTFATLASLAAAATVVGGVAVVATASDDPEATVVKIVDGDTLDVRYDGGTHRVRLLNIDTPEMGGAAADTECLAEEATQYLKKRLPVGSPVTLEWDEDHLDTYERQLRGVFDDAGFVNEDIVRNGFALPMHIDPNHRYKDQIDEAYAHASRAATGLFDPAHGCTLVSRTERVNEAVERGDRAAAHTHAVALQTLLKDQDSFASRILSPVERTTALTRLSKIATSHAPKKQAAPSPSPRPSPKPSPRPAPSVSTTPPAPAPTTPPPARTTPPPAPSPTYTPPPEPAPRSTSTPAPPPPASTRPNNSAPCRSYAPGGKSFTYIDCDTRQPI